MEIDSRRMEMEKITTALEFIVLHSYIPLVLHNHCENVQWKNDNVTSILDHVSSTFPNDSLLKSNMTPLIFILFGRIEYNHSTIRFVHIIEIF